MKISFHFFESGINVAYSGWVGILMVLKIKDLPEGSEGKGDKEETEASRRYIVETPLLCAARLCPLSTLEMYREHLSCPTERSGILEICPQLLSVTG